MAEPDIVARVISLVSTVFALTSLLIAVLSYRRGRPRIIVKDARVVTAVQSTGNKINSADDTMLVQVLLVNRGQAKVQLASGTHSGGWPVMVEFQRSRAPRRMSQRRIDHSHGQTLVAPLVDHIDNEQIDGFSGLAVSGVLADELLTRAMKARLWRMRVRITLSSGDVIFSHWFQTPNPSQGSINRRHAELRRDALTAMKDLSQALRESGVPQNRDILHRLAKRTGIKTETLHELLYGRGKPTWPVIAKIVDAINDSDNVLARSRLVMWKSKWAVSMDAGRWLGESTYEPDSQ